MGFRRCNDALLPLDAAFTPQLPVSTRPLVAYVKALLSFGGLALCGAAANQNATFSDLYFVRNALLGPGDWPRRIPAIN
jgi:hypothetical protein